MWNKYHENMLKKWATMCKTYTNLHSLCAQYYEFWHRWLGIPVVILGGATASSIFSTNEEFNKEWTYINGSMALIVTCLAGVSNFLGTSDKTSKHQNASYKYTKIGMDIEALLSFPRSSRSFTAQEFIHAKKSEILEIRENCPEILPHIMKEYIEKFDSNLHTYVCKKNSSKPNEINYNNMEDSEPYTPPDNETNQRRKMMVMREHENNRDSFIDTVFPNKDDDDGIQLDNIDDNKDIEKLSSKLAEGSDFEESDEE